MKASCGAASFRPTRQTFESRSVASKGEMFLSTWRRNSLVGPTSAWVSRSKEAAKFGRGANGSESGCSGQLRSHRYPDMRWPNSYKVASTQGRKPTELPLTETRLLKGYMLGN